VTLRDVGSSAALRTVCVAVAVAPLLSGCVLFHQRNGLACTQRPFQGSAVSGHGLVVPPGLSAPDTRNGVKIPTLNETEQPRPASAPCLADPPSFAAGEAGALPARNAPSAPLPTPLPAPLPTPAAPPILLPEPGTRP